MVCLRPIVMCRFQEENTKGWKICSSQALGSARVHCHLNGVYPAAQGMAGNIIHAIATTNAIVGGLIVIEALKLLAGHPEHCKVRRATLILSSASAADV